MAFKGTFDHTLDAKNRLTVPSRFRDAFKAGAVLVRAAAPCVAVYPEQTYSAQTEAVLARYVPFSPEREDLERMFYANAFDQTPDSANRLIIAAPLLEHAGLVKDAKVIGKGDHFEIWSPERWQSYESELIARTPELRARLAHPA